MQRFLPLLVALMLAVAACGGDDPSLDPSDIDIDTGDTDAETDAAATFATPSDGDTVSTPVSVEMTATGVRIVPAGDPVEGQGHFHVSVDTGCTADGEAIPGPGDEAEAQGYYHFGSGASQGELELEPGTYDLCLQLADGAHQAFGATDEITITVE